MAVVRSSELTVELMIINFGTLKINTYISRLYTCGQMSKNDYTHAMFCVKFFCVE